MEENIRENVARQRMNLQHFKFFFDYATDDSEKYILLDVAYESFYENLNNTDDLLVLNLDKKGIEGYIGYESFAEMSYLIVKKIQNNSNQKIYIYKMPSKEVGCYEEISHFINLGYIELFK